MGTRGAYGFIKNETEKVTYNHFGSYPSGLGLDIVNYIKSRTDEQLESAEKSLAMVNGDSKPTPKQVVKCEKFTNLNVSNQTTKDWYCLLRKAQGCLDKHEEAGFMIEGREFLKDSLFCEWAYVINLDTKKLEIYKGFNKNPKAQGRYASAKGEGDGYFGVELIRNLALSEIRKLKDVDKFIEHLEK